MEEVWIFHSVLPNALYSTGTLSTISKAYNNELNWLQCIIFSF